MVNYQINKYRKFSTPHCERSDLVPSTLPCALAHKHSLPSVCTHEKASRAAPRSQPAGGCWDWSPVTDLETKKGDGKEVKHPPHRELISSGGDEGSASTGCGGVASIGI